MRTARLAGLCTALAILTCACRSETEEARAQPSVARDSTPGADSIPEERPDTIRATLHDSATMMLAMLPPAPDSELDGESAVAGSPKRSEEVCCEPRGFRDSVFFADQREVGIPRFLDEPIPAGSRGTVAHCKGKPISVKSFEKARRLGSLGRRTRGRGTPLGNARGSNQGHPAREE